SRTQPRAQDPGYRDWKLISVAHEEGNLNSLGAILGNDVVLKAYREGKLPFPDGTIIAALHWRTSRLEENNKIFGRSQSFIAGHPTNVQFMVKRRTIMKVFALGLFAKPLTDEQRKLILPKEVPDTLRLYLDGKIDQFWFREDKPGGVVFLMNSTSVEEAKSIIEALPLAANGYLVFEYIPVGPLQPLGLLIKSPQPEYYR